MRWWMWVIAVVIVGAVGFSLLRGKPRVVGVDVLQLLESRRGALRGAIELIDYEPDERGVAAAREVALERGVGAMGGVEVTEGDRRRWARGRGVEFVWRKMLKGEQPLRVALGGGEGRSSGGAGELDYAMSMMGYYRGGVEEVVEKAVSELEAMSDEELLLAWLRADRGVMAETDDVERAVREGLLLMARDGEGPVLVFERKGGLRVYVFPEVHREHDAVWVQMEGYRGGDLVWTGVLRMEGEVEPERVRAMAVRMAEAAGAE